MRGTPVPVLTAALLVLNSTPPPPPTLVGALAASLKKNFLFQTGNVSGRLNWDVWELHTGTDLV